MAGAGASERSPVHGRPGHRDRECRVALDQGRPRVLAREPSVGDQRVRARLRRLPAPRRASGRPHRAQAHLPRGHRRVHAGVPLRRSSVVRDVVDRRTRSPGSRSGDHHAVRALDPLDDLRRRARAQHRTRRLGRGRRVRRRRRRPPRRDPHRRAQLGVDLLRQRPGRHHRARAGAAASPREPRRAREEVRRSRWRARHRRSLLARLRDHAGGSRGLGRGQNAGVLRHVGGSGGTPSR